jgi:hypothetical protein
LVLLVFDPELLQSHRWLLAEIHHAYLLRPVLHMRCCCFALLVVLQGSGHLITREFGTRELGMRKSKDRLMVMQLGVSSSC